MTETTLKTLVQELTTVRILCRKGNCGGVVELPVEQLGKLEFDSASCPVCGKQFVSQQSVSMAKFDPLPSLGKVLEAIVAMESEIAVEFPIRIDTGKQQ